VVRIDRSRKNQEFQNNNFPCVRETWRPSPSVTLHRCHRLAATFLSTRLTCSLATLQGDITDGERGNHYPDVESRTAPSQERSLLRAFVVAVKRAFCQPLSGEALTTGPPSKCTPVVQSDCRLAPSQHGLPIQIEKAAARLVPASCCKEYSQLGRCACRSCIDKWISREGQRAQYFNASQ
jgi:hypothetical protein